MTGIASAGFDVGWHHRVKLNYLPEVEGIGITKSESAPCQTDRFLSLILDRHR